MTDKIPHDMWLYHAEEGPRLFKEGEDDPGAGWFDAPPNPDADTNHNGKITKAEIVAALKDRGVEADEKLTKAELQAQLDALPPA